MSASERFSGAALSAAPDNVIYLADHSVVLALPALIPAFVIVGVVLYVVAKDRRAERDEKAEQTGESDNPETDRVDDEEK
nr:hypothetical protein [Rhodococcus sp. (in: high G+C Gram-positive bacteria)]